MTKRSDKLWRHELGAAASAGPIYDEKDELYDIDLGKTRDKKYLVLNIEAKDTTEALYLRADHPADHFAVFLPREKKHRYYVDHREGLFYIRTNKHGRNFEIVTAPVADPARKNWKPFVPQRDDVLVQDIDLFRDFAVLAGEIRRAQPPSRLQFPDRRPGRTSPSPSPCTRPSPAARPTTIPRPSATTIRASSRRPSIYDYDVATRQIDAHEAAGSAGRLRSRASMLPSGCGPPPATASECPSPIVYKKGFEKNGKAPLFLYAYGSYGIGTPASFSSNRISLLDRGMAYAIAHIRGGDEMGERWREDGMLMKKKNTFNDFIDCAEYLIAQKWTSKERLVIEGGSAGGLLMGAVVNMRPDLFRAVHSAVPFVDVMNTMMDATLPLTVGEYLEWGNPNEKAAYDYMKTYSPYDNLEKRAYPAMLVTTSFNDSQVMYWEPAKYVARLRALKTDAESAAAQDQDGARRPRWRFRPLRPP